MFSLNVDVENPVRVYDTCKNKNPAWLMNSLQVKGQRRTRQRF